MSTVPKAADLYPVTDPEEMYAGCWDDYTPILNAFGPIQVRIDQEDYSGDTWVLYYEPDTGRYGYLCVGWGSCSGCDALQACKTHEEVDDLITTLHNQIRWFDSEEAALDYFITKDWAVEYYGDLQAFHSFLTLALSRLGHPSPISFVEALRSD